MRKIVVGMTIVFVIFIGIMMFLERPERTDVVVIGAGASGISAAIEAKQAGLSVVLLEKMPRIGGNSQRATGGMNAVGSVVQEREGLADSKSLFLADTLAAGHYQNDRDLANLLVEKSGETVNWLIGFGADLTDLGRLAGHRVDRTHRPSGGAPVGSEVVRVLGEQLVRLGINLRVENKVIQLLNEDNRVTGVLVRNEEGREYEIMADSVVIASGGFGGSSERFVFYNPVLKGFKTTNHAGATGDYIDLVADLPIELIDMEKIQAHPTVEPHFGILITEAIRGNGGILINMEGNRFTDEMAFRDILSEEMRQQTQGKNYLIFDESIRNGLSAADAYIDMQLTKEAESIEDMSLILGIDTAALTRAIDRYNGFVAGGSDDDFQRRDLPVQLRPPFYAILVQPGVHYCMGGLPINANAQVLDYDGNPIPGLFACGEATGGIHGNNRLGGNSMTDSIVFGRIAGQSVDGVN
jgi:fumarate reductase flavoprotein subunit